LVLYSHIRGLPRSITRELNVVATHNTSHITTDKTPEATTLIFSKRPFLRTGQNTLI